MGGFKTVEVDQNASTLTVGGAVTFRMFMIPFMLQGKKFIRFIYA